MKVYVPRSLEEALKIKEENPGFIWLSGGSDIMVYMKFGKLKPEGLINIHRLSELHEVKKTDKDEFLLGAALTFTQLLEHSIVREIAPDLLTAIRTIGSVQIRNQGTLGGNIANASPAGDSLPGLYLRNAILYIRNRSRERKLSIGEFIQGPGKTALEPEEIIHSVSLSPLVSTERHGFFKVGARKAMAISKVSLAFHQYSRLPYWKGGIALGSVGPTVIRAVNTEKYLGEHPFSLELISKLEPVFRNEISAIDDIRSTRDYRSSVAFDLLKKALYCS